MEDILLIETSKLRTKEGQEIRPQSFPHTQNLFTWRRAISNEVKSAAKLKHRKKIARNCSYKNKTDTMRGKQSKDEIRITS